MACFAALTGNEHELKGLYLRAVSFFCLRGFFFSYITKFPRKIDISGKGQRQTGDYRSNWISTTFHCKGQPSAVGFQPTVPLLVSNTSEILQMPRYPLLFSLFGFFFFLIIVLVFSFLECLIGKKVGYVVGFAGGSQLAGQWPQTRYGGRRDWRTVPCFPWHPEPAQIWAIAIEKNSWE